jgi:uncharacterized membrane protein
MRSRAEFLGHSIHQMLVVFPLGLLATSLVFDIAGLIHPSEGLWITAYWMLTAGIIGAVIAAPFGTIDWLNIPARTRAKRIGALHGGGNLVVSAFFVGSWLLREYAQPLPASALACSIAGAGLALVTAWLGGELVARLGVGVHEDANLDAESSLRPQVRKRAPATMPQR